MVNLKYLIQAYVIRSSPTHWYVYRKQYNFLGIEIVKEGIYECLYTGGYKRIEELPDRYFMKNETVYEKPSVMLKFSGDIQKKYEFEDEESAQVFLDDCLKKAGGFGFNFSTGCRSWSNGPGC